VARPGWLLAAAPADRPRGTDPDVNPRVEEALPVQSSELETERVTDKPTSGASGSWRPWTLWLPCALAVAWSGLLVIGDGYAAVMGSWDTPAPGLHWLGVGAAGQGVLAAGTVGVLVAGVTHPRWRRRAVITAWTSRWRSPGSS
jgi:hypothetical protein